MELEQLNNEIMEQWCWNNGTMVLEQWSNGIMEPRNNTTMEQLNWNNEKMEQWNNVL